MTLREGVEAELRAASSRSSAFCTPAAVRRCEAALDDLCSLFKDAAPRRLVDASPGELLALPLLLRSAAPLTPEGTIDIDRADSLAEALAQEVSPDRRGQWYAAFDERLARDDFVGTQLLLDRAEQLGVPIDESERQRREESRTMAIQARKHSLLYEIKEDRKSVV